ncbi:hypothetical protein EMCRGX_G029759 [Ephydatia muelleri]
MQQSMQFQAAFLFFALSLRQDSNILCSGSSRLTSDEDGKPSVSHDDGGALTQRSSSSGEPPPSSSNTINSMPLISPNYLEYFSFPLIWSCCVCYR